MKQSQQLGFALAIVASLAFCSQADATLVRITVTSTGGATPVTPVFAAFHDGTYDIARSGGTASAGLEALAELGMTNPIMNEFGTAGGRRSTAIAGAGGPIMPGETVSHDFTIDMTGGTNSFLSLATMVLPSSDYFLGTVSDPGDTTFGISLAGLTTTNPISFSLTQLYDAGTEQNDFAFSAPPDPAMMFGGPFANLPTSTPPGGVDEDPAMMTGPGVIRMVNTPFASFLNTPVGFDPAAATISQLNFTISAVPEPTTGLAIGCILMGTVMTRRRRKRA